MVDNGAQLPGIVVYLSVAAVVAIAGAITLYLRRRSK